jgi:hypothetical protein
VQQVETAAQPTTQNVETAIAPVAQVVGQVAEPAPNTVAPVAPPVVAPPSAPPRPAAPPATAPAPASNPAPAPAPISAPPVAPPANVEQSLAPASASAPSEPPPAPQAVPPQQDLAPRNRTELIPPSLTPVNRAETIDLPASDSTDRSIPESVSVPTDARAAIAPQPAQPLTPVAVPDSVAAALQVTCRNGLLVDATFGVPIGLPCPSADDATTGPASASGNPLDNSAPQIPSAADPASPFRVIQDLLASIPRTGMTRALTHDPLARLPLIFGVLLLFVGTVFRWRSTSLARQVG